jgi:hypothetical protein
MKQRLSSIDSYENLANEEQENNENRDIKDIKQKLEDENNLDDKNLGQYYFIGKDYSNIYKEDFKNLEEFSTGIYLF